MSALGEALVKVAVSSCKKQNPLVKKKEGELCKKSYKLQGKTDVQGIPIAIENRRGSVRSGKNSDGTEWKTKFKAPYGYIKGTKGRDGEEVDAYVGPDKDAPKAYVVHQRKDTGKGYDEDKVMLGFRSKAEAKETFLQHYDDPKYLGPVSTMTVEELKERVAKKSPSLRKSGSAGKAVYVEGPPTRVTTGSTAADKVRGLSSDIQSRVGGLRERISGALGTDIRGLTKPRILDTLLYKAVEGAEELKSAGLMDVLRTPIPGTKDWLIRTGPSRASSAISKGVKRLPKPGVETRGGVTSISSDELKRLGFGDLAPKTAATVPTLKWDPSDTAVDMYIGPQVVNQSLARKVPSVLSRAASKSNKFPTRADVSGEPSGDWR